MRTRKLLATAATGALLLSLAITPASADDIGVTFEVTAGLLSIDNDNATVDFGETTSSVLGTTAGGPLGTTTVTDARASLAGYTVQAASTDFVSDQGTPGDTGDDETILASAATLYHSVPVSVPDGIAVPGTTTHLQVAPLTLGNAAADFLSMTTLGSTTVTYTPTFTVTIAQDVIAGIYAGTVTQTVS